MKRRSLWRVVFQKELRETLRDRRTMLVIFLLPLVFYPLLAFGMVQWIESYLGQQKAKPTRVRIEAADDDRRELVALLREGEHIVFVGQSRAPVDVVVAVEPDFRRNLYGEDTAKVILRHDSRDEAAEIGLARVRKALETANARFREQRLQKRGLKSALTEPLQITEQAQSSPLERAAHRAAGILPLLILMFAAAAALYPAIDLTAGEKERGTLETLLASPVSARDLVIGKYLAVASVSLLGAILNLSAIGLTISKLIPSSASQASLELPWLRMLAIVPGAVVASLFVSAIVMAIACLARNTKDAQLFAVPVHLALLVPGFAAQLPGVELNWGTALVPCVNVALVIKALVTGDVAWTLIAVALIVPLGYAALTLAFAERLFAGEGLLFGGEGAGTSRRSARDENLKDSHVSASDAVAVVAIAFLLLVFVGQKWQAANLVSGILRTELLLVLLPCWLLVRFRKLGLPALGAVSASPQAFVGAVLCGFGGWAVVAALVDGIQQRVLPMPPEFLDAMRHLLFPDPPRSLLLELGVFALAPAVCEETLFRGLLLRATVPTLGRWRAVFLNGLVFGAFHLSLYRFAPTAALGMLLAVLAVRSGSILPGIVFHVLNNGIALVVGRQAGPQAALGDAALPMQVTAIGLLAVIAGIWLSGRKNQPPDSLRITGFS